MTTASIPLYSILRTHLVCLFTMLFPLFIFTDDSFGGWLHSDVESTIPSPHLVKKTALAPRT